MSISLEDTEDRFRVDRRRLESMLQYPVEFSENQENSAAHQFFNKVMAQTQTKIFWPSRLKVGAKSKKDPHIKISGLPKNVQKAKSLIQDVFCRKFTKLTLKVDVAHSDHGTLIGKNGSLQKEIRSKTGTDIHFPDANKVRMDLAEKSNQVSLNGLSGDQPSGMEEARVLIRHKQPLIVSVVLPSGNLASGNVLTTFPEPGSHSILEQFASQLDVHIFLQKVIIEGGRSRLMWSVKGVSGRSENIITMIDYMVNYLNRVVSPQAALQIPVTLSLEIEKRHLDFLKETALMRLSHDHASNGENLYKLLLKTFNVTIDFVDSPSCSVVLSHLGDARHVVALREFLIGCLPIYLTCDIGDDVDLDAFVDRGSKVHNAVRLDVSQRRLQGGNIVRTLTLLTAECNTANLYKMWLAVSGEQIPSPTSPTRSVIPLPYMTVVPNSPLRCLLPGTVPPSSMVYSTSQLQSNTSLNSAIQACPNNNYISVPLPHLITSFSTTSLNSHQSSESSTQSATRCQSVSDFQFAENGEEAVDSELCLERRAPGAEYSRKKLLASKIMTQKVTGPRFPTSEWSGLYFSKSQPAQAFNQTNTIAAKNTKHLGQNYPIPENSLPFAQSCYYDMGAPDTSSKTLCSSQQRDENYLLKILREHDLEQHADVLVANEIDFTTFITLTDSDFKELGYSFGIRKRMKRVIDELVSDFSELVLS